MVEKYAMLTLDETFELINIAIATARLKSLETPYTAIRPSMHSILVGRVGSLKSSIMRIICKEFKVLPTFNLTSATILGSVDKSTGIPLLPAIWEHRNSILPIDELYIDAHNNSQRSALSVFLSVLEHPEFEKKIAYRINDYKEKDKDLYCMMNNGKICVKTRFVFIANTMQNLIRPQKMIELEALKTRCLVLPYYPTSMEIRSMLSGHHIFEYKKYRHNLDCKVPLKEFERILDMVTEHNVSEEYYARTVGDLCRTYAIVGMNEEVFNLILRIREKKNYR